MEIKVKEFNYVSNLNGLSKILEDIQSWVKIAIKNDEIKFFIKLAIEEFSSNILKYSHLPFTKLSIKIVIINEKKLICIIKDNSKSFDFTNEPIPQKSLGDGGLGIKIILNTFDKSFYISKNGENITVLTKNF